MLDNTLSFMSEKLKRVCDPFQNKRFTTFVGKLKDLPKELVQEAVENGSIHVGDSPESEIKCIRVFSI